MASEIKVGTFTGDGAAQNIELGFVPDHIRIINITDGDAGWSWFSDMADGTAIDEASALALVASNGVSPLEGDNSTRAGFTAGTAMSESGKVFAYTAIRNAEY